VCALATAECDAIAGAFAIELETADYLKRANLT
jgi:hypothetical protein